MSRKIEDIDFEDIDFSDYEELRKEAEELLNDKEIQKMMKKQKKISKIYKIAEFFEMVVEYGFWKVITSKVKREYFDLEGVDDEN